MKKLTTILKLFAAAAVAVAYISPVTAQVNNGAACGCPTPVSSRASVNLSTLVDGNSEFIGNPVLDCSKQWVVDKKVYVKNGSTLTINAGTVIRGLFKSTPDSACALIVERGGKIIADGTPDCMIIMTNTEDPLDGTYSFSTPTAKKWGGLVICGRASNNFTLSPNGPFNPLVDGHLATADGLGNIEGFSTVLDARHQFGADLNNGERFDDNDNSGILRYVSVRFAGAVLHVGAEINSVSFGSVGRGTTVDHVEVIGSSDDNMEFWGGTVNVKNCTFMFGNDDMFDWDAGYSGHVQNLFGVKVSTSDTTNAATKDADNGFEMDADDDRSGNGSGKAIGDITSQTPPGKGGYRSHPVIYNCTFIGTDKKKLTSDNTGMSAICAKELTEGEIYNCIFANFAVGLNLWTDDITKTADSVLSAEGNRSITTSSSGQSCRDAYDNWINGDLKVKNNTFVGIGHVNPSGFAGAPLALDVNKKRAYIDNPADHQPSSSDTAKFYTTDGNIAVPSLTGFNYIWAEDGDHTTTTQYDAVPDAQAAVTTTSTVAPADGFFTAESYRGAFQPGKPNWLSGWAYATLLKTTAGLQSNPTDINQDGITDINDFNLFLPKFGQLNK